jgi:uncharacterized protein (DUF2147 family)
MKRFLAAILLAPSAPAWAAPNVAGNWLTEDKSAIIALAPCGQQMCGSIARILVNRPGRPWTDAHNPDPALRGRPVLGMRIISGLNPGQNKWEGGRIYDPKSGKSYKSYVQLNPDGSLKVAGCILFVCQGQRWTRAR